jgi:hypothetical protein
MSVDSGKTVEELLDLINAALPYFEKLKFSYPQKYTDHPILNRVLSSNAMKSHSGKSIEWRVVVDDGGEAKSTRLYATKEYNKTDKLKKATAPWASITTEWIMDRREPLMSADAEQIVDLMKVERATCEARMANKFEEYCWQTITSEDDEFGSFRGIPYYISKGASSGFTGKSTVDRSANTITSVAGLNANTYERWANYFDTYTDFDGYDAIADLEPMFAAMFKAWMSIRFKAPRTAQDLEPLNPLGNYRIYMDLDTLLAYEFAVRQYNQGQNFGYDVGKFNGMTAFNRTPIEYSPFLDIYADADITGEHPIYFVNMNKFGVDVLKGDEFYEHPPLILPESGGNVAAVNVDLTCQLKCEDRRSQALLCVASE